MNTLRALAAFALAASLASPAFADTHISYVRSDGVLGDQVYVKDGKIRMETGLEHGYSILDTAGSAMIIVSRQKSKFYVFDEAAAAGLSQGFVDAEQKLGDASRKADKNAETLVEKSLRLSRHGGLKAAVFRALIDYAARFMVVKFFSMSMELKDLGKKEIVAGYACQDEQLLIRGKPSETRCVERDLDAAGFPPADLAAAKAGLEDFRQIAAALEPMAHGISSTLPSGLIIRTERLDWDPVKSRLSTVTNTLQSFSTATLTADLFGPPPGYSQGTLEELGQ
jgi:hypothetical protein